MLTTPPTNFSKHLCFSFLGFLLLASPYSLAPHAAEVNALSTQASVHIRTLAASCAACHGTDGNSLSITPVLAGLDATYFSTQMIAFKNGERTSTVMHHHATGLYTDEIYQLANYFSQQKRTTKEALKPQALREGHD